MDLGEHSAEVPASRGPNGEGIGASRPARGPKGHRHRHPERTYAAVRRRSSHARELIGLAHARMDRVCCVKPVQVAGMRKTCHREQSDAVRPRPPPQRYGRLRLLVDQVNDTFKGATREQTLDRVAPVPKLGRHNLLSTRRLTTAFDAPMRVYPAAATIRPRFGRKTLVFCSLRPETGFLEIKARRRRYRGAANNASNGSAIDGDSQGDPSTSWRHAGPSASCSAPTLTTRDEPAASATSPPANTSCVRLPYGTPQPTPDRQFPVTR